MSESTFCNKGRGQGEEIQSRNESNNNLLVSARVPIAQEAKNIKNSAKKTVEAKKTVFAKFFSISSPHCTTSALVSLALVLTGQKIVFFLY